MPEETNELLEELGLSKKEIIVYLTLLKLGEATASRVSEAADLNRITTYMILKSLKEKSFSSIYIKGNVQYFKPRKPEQILTLLDEKKERLKILLPLLKSQEKIITSPTEASILEGKTATSIMFDAIIEEAKKTKYAILYGNYTAAQRAGRHYASRFRRVRLLHKIKIDAVLDSLQELDVGKNIEWQKLSKWKENSILSKTNVLVMAAGDTVGYMLPKGEFTTILIKNKDIADREMFFFNLLRKDAV